MKLQIEYQWLKQQQNYKDQFQGFDVLNSSMQKKSHLWR